MWTAIRHSLIALGLLAVVPVQAAVLSPFTATYRASHGIIGLGEATFELSRDNGCWRWHGVANPSGLAAMLIGTVTDDSRFCVTDSGELSPRQFRHHESDDAEDSYQLGFNPTDTTASLNGGEAFDVPADAVDPFLLQIAARRWLADAENPAEAGAREFTVVDEDEIKTYRLAVSEGPSVETAAGSFKTIRLARVDDGDKQLVFWAAPALDFLPVRVEHRKDGSTQIRLDLTSVERTDESGGSI